MTLGDLLLDWMSEVGTGSWGDARDTIAALQTEEADRRPAWQVAAEIEDSGHVEIDWDSDKWAIATPALCVLPGTSLCAVWTGARPRRRREQLEQLLLDNPSIYDFAIDQTPGPSARFIKGASIEDLEQCASELESTLVIDPATSMTARLRPLPQRPTELAAAPATSENVEWFNPQQRQWTSIEHPGNRHGLFRVERYGRRAARWRDGDGQWFTVEQPEGMFMAMRSETRYPVLRWRAPAPDLSQPSFLEVRQPMVLPTLARRAAVASSGLLPLRDGPWVRYRNVSRDNAERIAASLDQAVEVTEPGA